MPQIWSEAVSKSAIKVRMRNAEIEILSGADPQMVEIVLRYARGLMLYAIMCSMSAVD